MECLRQPRVARRPRAAALLVPIAALISCSGAERAPDLLMISLDTVRRDHLSIYGYERPTTPGLEAWARTATVFESAFAQDTRTNPSHASMFTGLYPHIHGSQANSRLLPAERITLAEVLSAAGYATGAFVSGVTMKRSMTALDQGFEVWDEGFDAARRDGGETVERARAWWAGLPEDRPRFLFVHLYDAHGPYLPPARYIASFHSQTSGATVERIPLYQRVTDSAGIPQTGLNGYVDRYDAALRYLDDLTAALVEATEGRRTVVVVLSDHGETLGERFHPLDHGGQVFDEQIRIPLIIRAAGIAPRRVAVPVETIDLFPTILDLLGVESPPSQGRTLVPAMHGERIEPREHVFSSARAVSRRHADRGYELDLDRRIRTVRSSRFKLIEYPGVGGDYYELYDLELDPRERRDVLGREPGVAEELRGVLREWGQGDVGDPGPSPRLDPETFERLRSLGYLG